jgi:hypothetical protein
MSEIHNSNRKDTNRTNVILFSIAGVLLLAIIIIFVAFAGDSDYEEGNEYLRNKQYNEALAYYQKVDADDKEFRLAQSRINYIYGIRAYESGNMDEARVYLVKVDPSDEYYQAAKLMLDRLAAKNTDTKNEGTAGEIRKDTVIVREQTIIERDKKEKEEKEKDPPKGNDEALSKKYISGVQSNINSFQNLYQSAYTADVQTKRKISQTLSSASSKFDALQYTASQKDEKILELKRLVDMWMDKRIAFINQLITENSINEQNTSRGIKEEGDKLYNMLLNQLTQVKRTYGI